MEAMENKAKLLFIDDEEIVLDSCAEILADSGFQIATAGNGASGLQMFEEIQPDLVFVDLKMPGISGFEVLDKIHELDPTIVSVVITGFATVNSAVEAMKKGAYDFLPKPFTPEELRLIVRRGLEKRQLVLETIALRREKEMLREHFAAIVSHELKSPLSVVQQNLFALTGDLADKLSEEQKNRIIRLQSRIDDLMKLVNTWLRSISVDITSIRESFAPASVSIIVSRAVENVQSQAIRKAIEIETSLPDAMHPIEGNELTMVEALGNIIGNAVKYTHIGGHVSVRAREENRHVHITVADNGIGIAQEDLPYLFDDFFVGKTRPGGERSSGVGLAITRRIIEAHDGSITVDSSPGKGSTFTIRLPAQNVAADQPTILNLEMTISEGDSNEFAKTDINH
jgi:two-component system, sensor histidine kinase and response regulator